MVVVSKPNGSVALRLDLDKSVEYIIDEMLDEGVRLIGAEAWNDFVVQGDFRVVLRAALIDYATKPAPLEVDQTVVAIALMRGLGCGCLHDGERLLCSDPKVPSSQTSCACQHIGLLAASTLTACVRTFSKVMERINVKVAQPAHA